MLNFEFRRGFANLTKAWWDKLLYAKILEIVTTIHKRKGHQIIDISDEMSYSSENV